MAQDDSTPVVTIDLSGETFTLRPDLGPAMGISALFGGIFPAGQRALQGELLALAQIVRLGAALDAKRDQELADKVFRSGVTNVSTKVMEYIGLLMNGGVVKKGAAAPGEGEPSDQPQP